MKVSEKTNPITYFNKTLFSITCFMSLTHRLQCIINQFFFPSERRECVCRRWWPVIYNKTKKNLPKIRTRHALYDFMFDVVTRGLLFQLLMKTSHRATPAQQHVNLGRFRSDLIPTSPLFPIFISPACRINTYEKFLRRACNYTWLQNKRKIIFISVDWEWCVFVVIQVQDFIPAGHNSLPH